MPQAPITFVINGKTYSLAVDSVDAIGHMPAEDRRQLIALLQAIQAQEASIQARAQDKVEQAGSPDTSAPGATETPAVARPERLGSGDVDALMARLVMEEGRERKPAPTARGLYTVLGAVFAVIILLIMIL